MATSASASPRPQNNPATLKFTAVKVDVSALTSATRCKAFVISSRTTSCDLAEMVLRKLKIDVSGHVNGTCLVGKSSDDGIKRVLAGDERILGALANKSKRALTLQLVPAETIDDSHVTARAPSGQEDCIKAGNLSDPVKNGMTLPGYKQTDTNYNVPIGAGFLTSTPNPDNCESMASTVDSGFIIQYEPCTEHPPPYKSQRMRSKSFEMARDNGYRLDDSIGNASDSGMLLAVNGVNGNDVNGNETPEHGSDSYSNRPSPKDGFQILQSKNSAWTPFSRHVSDGFIKSLSNQALPSSCVSVPDVNNDPSTSKLTRRRSLPKLSLSQEQLEEKKKSVTNLFASKLKNYIQKAQASKHGRNTTAARRRYNVPQRSVQRDDDTMSVTSEEVAEIMSSASPMKPYEEDEEESEDESRNGTESENQIPHNVFQPVCMVTERDPSPELIHQQLEHVNINGEDHRRKESPSKHSLGEFVEESMRNLITRTPQQVRDSNTKTKDGKMDATSGSQHSGPRTLRSQHSGPRTPQYDTSSSSQAQLDRGVPLFTLLTTHLLAPVMVRRNRERAPNKFIGIRLCDVTYAKCVRHVIKHWETNSRQFFVDPKLSERVLVAIGGVDRRTTVILAGKLFRGDIIVEINGKSALEIPARDVISQMIPAEVVSLVVARSRINVERAQSP